MAPYCCPHTLWALQMLPEPVDGTGAEGRLQAATGGTSSDLVAKANDFHVSFAGQPGHAGKHLLIFGAYESTQQQPGWEWDPIVYFLADFGGKTMDIHAAGSTGPTRCAPPRPVLTGSRSACRALCF